MRAAIQKIISMNNKRNTYIAILHGITTVYLIALVYILFFWLRANNTELGLVEYFKTSSNLKIFASIQKYLYCLFNGLAFVAIINLFGNLLLFMPLGALLPLYFQVIKGKPGKFWQYTVFIVLTLIFVEITQLITRRGIFDIDDILLNLLGAIIGLFLAKLRNIRNVYQVIAEEADV